MSTTEAQATEAMYLAFETGWAATGHPFTFQTEAYDPPQGTTVWARFSINHTAAPQRSLGGPDEGNRKFARIGSAFTQIFTLAQESAVSPGVSQPVILGSLVRDIFEGKTLPGTNVRFIQVVSRRSGVSGRWLLTIVEASFDYTETK